MRHHLGNGELVQDMTERKLGGRKLRRLDSKLAEWQEAEIRNKLTVLATE